MTSPSVREALAPLQQRVELEDVWQLPEYVQLSPPDWMLLPRVLVAGIACVLLWSFAEGASSTELAIALTVLALTTVVVMRMRRRRSLPLGEGSLRAHQGRGCCVDVAQRCVRTQGVEPPQQWVLDAPQEWSVGVIAFTDRPRMRHGWRIELRHVRKGPVVRLCTVLHVGHAVLQPEAVQALADTMVERLGIRRAALSSSSGKLQR
ncbi:hypothetical protein [Comamonas sp. NoAH]|uniref:hypothetical protein n=1 Tax=Comamonas halotolerans TaxID=3041496 RepID=UPI0024E0669E|nr:hypothetical protein [Comamonas sp. NoAH]